MLLAPSSTYCCAPWPTPRMLSRTCSSFDKQIFFLFRIINQPVAELDCEQARSRNERVSRGSKCARFDFVCLSTDAQFIPNRLPSLWGWVYNFNWVETQSDALGKSHRELDVMFFGRVWQNAIKCESFSHNRHCTWLRLRFVRWSPSSIFHQQSSKAPSTILSLYWRQILEDCCRNINIIFPYQIRHLLDPSEILSIGSTTNRLIVSLVAYQKIHSEWNEAQEVSGHIYFCNQMVANKARTRRIL